MSNTVLVIILGSIFFLLIIYWLATYIKPPTIDWLRSAQQTLNNTNTTGLPRTILQNFVDCYKINLEISAEEKIITNLEKERGYKTRENYKNHKQQLFIAQQKLITVQLDVDKELSPRQKELFGKVCEAFTTLRETKKVWNIPDTTNVASRKEIVLSTGTFNFLKSAYNIPVIDVGDKKYYFYPKYIIEVIDICDFTTYKIVEQEFITYGTQRFTEIGHTYPSDVEIDFSYFQYQTKNGTPDRRYAYNPKYTVVNYGILTLHTAPQQVTFMFSNKKYFDTFAKTYNQYITCLLGNEKNHDLTTKDNMNSVEYNAIKQATTNLSTYVLKMAKQSNIVEYINSKVHIDGIEKLSFVVDAKICLLALCDVLKCYKGLGYGINSERKEGIGIAIFTLQLITEKAVLIYYDEGEMTCKGLPIVTPIIKSIDKTLTTTLPDDKFFIIEVLRSNSGIDEGVIDQYVVLLYRFASVLAKTDNTIDETESKWLSTIMQFTKKNTPQNTTTLDPNFEEIARYTIRQQNISILDLQRQFGINEDKAKQLMEQLQCKGIVWPERGWYEAREVIVKDIPTLNKILSAKPTNTLIEETHSNTIELSTTRTTKGQAEQQLEELIGLNNVKEEVKRLTSFIKVQQLRQQKGMKANPISYHCVFTGNPGTGKTTVARILSEIYRDLGILKKGHLIETDRSGLVAEYVGQTAVKTNKIIDSAIDGVLFIDEAYSLVQGTGNDYGKEAISTLLKRMEDDRDRLIIILAGYGEEMKQFIDSNPGLQSRFNRYIHFEDYTADDLMEIFQMNIKKNDYVLETEATNKVHELFIQAVEHKDKNFGNGRYARNVLENVLQNQAMRVATIQKITETILRTIIAEDIPTT